MTQQYITLPDGTQRALGNNAPPAGLMRAWPEFGATPTVPMVARSQWPALIAAFDPGPDFPFLSPVTDQDGRSQCNANDTITLLEMCRMEQGLPYVQLSPADLYDRINGGVDQGSFLEDALHEVMVNGVGTAQTCGLLWSRGMTGAPPAERARFKLIEAFICPTFDHCMSAVLQGFKLSTGVVWCNNYTPASDGWLPNPGSSVGGHAIAGFKPAMKGSKFGIWHQNSWSEGWGLRGRFVIPEVAYSAGAVGGWWAARAVTDEGGQVPVPQP